MLVTATGEWQDALYATMPDIPYTTIQSPSDTPLHNYDVVPPVCYRAQRPRQRWQIVFT